MLRLRASWTKDFTAQAKIVHCGPFFFWSATAFSMGTPSADAAIPVTITRPSFQMPVEWPVDVAALYSNQGSVQSEVLRGTVVGLSTPSTKDTGGASVRIALDGGMESATAGSYLLCLRRGPELRWVPCLASVPVGNKDSQGGSRVNKVEAMVLARPTARGGVTFVHEDALASWAPEGARIELTILRRLRDFHVDDSSGPWLRDAICIVASEAEDLAMEELKSVQVETRGAAKGEQHDILLRNTGFRQERTEEAPPDDEWDLARKGQLHRDCDPYHKARVNSAYHNQSSEQTLSFF